MARNSVGARKTPDYRGSAKKTALKQKNTQQEHSRLSQTQSAKRTAYANPTIHRNQLCSKLTADRDRNPKQTSLPSAAFIVYGG